MNMDVFCYFVVIFTLTNIGDVIAETKNTTFCNSLLREYNDTDTINDVVDVGITLTEALLLVICFGVFTFILAKTYNLLRVKVFMDKDNLDTDFDAGGEVSVGLTATTIVSQWTWAATLLQSSTVAAKYGISGPFWYASGATIQIILFAMLSIQLKIRSPGAKTFLQVIQARFGKKVHVVFCFFALMTNVIVTAMLMLGAAAVMTTLVENLSLELAAMIIVAVVGGYTFIGGLGATFYVSYFNTTLIFIIILIFVMKIYNEPDVEDNPLGTPDKVYNLLNCAIGPEDNKDNSYLTFLSRGGLMFGVINVVGNFGTVFVDQSYWQSSVAAKPRQGVWGFITGGLTWFAIPFTFATTMGLAYVALSTANGEELLTEREINEGLVPPTVAYTLMGKVGAILMTLMILMAVTSTGSAEVIAVASILVYDLYQIHWRPYRAVDDTRSCLLCGKHRDRADNIDNQCECYSMSQCKRCWIDDSDRASSKAAVLPTFKCPMHGPYRTYLEVLIGKKNWCIFWVAILIIPLTLLLQAAQVSLGWVYLFMGVVIGSSVVPIALTVFWTRLNGKAAVIGTVGGTLCGLTAWLVTASTFDGGLRSGVFLANTGQELSMLNGNIVAILTGAILTVAVSLATNHHMTDEQKEEEWEKTRDIDNPLLPWADRYASEIGHHDSTRLSNRPELKLVEKTFKVAKIAAIVSAVLLTVILIIIWPASMIAVNVMNATEFNIWVGVSQGWAWIGAVFIISVPIITEVYTIVKQVIRNRDNQDGEQKLNKDRCLSQYTQTNQACMYDNEEINKTAF
ncbi:uncharacterized protein LOC100367180 [Saccoglossus kowalevskii]|uniref:Urea-proton symporter DUR3-like n=1 Tax=Saccoglossus kowalevskii TaxID=10224 RepID=A0ABM0MTI5_SACKO|nr:PREDICTED: urea-proton symporter DUR3-like [Saccoglossus kowalevskii]